MTWRCHWADYNLWRATDDQEPHPVPLSRDFETYAEAALFHDLQKSLGMIVCVTAKKPRQRRRQPELPLCGEAEPRE